MQSNPIEKVDFSKHRTTTDILDSLRQDILVRENKPKYPYGIKTIDDITNGLRKNELTIVGAQTSHGKSAFSLFTAWNVAKLNVPVVFLSLEMCADDLLERLACIEFGLNGWKLLKADHEERERFKNNYEKFYTRLVGTPFEILDYAGRTIPQIEGVLEKFKPEFLFVDHAQKLSTKGFGSKYEALSELAHRLGDLALHHKCGIILASQINRGGEYLKGSGDLEETCANLLYLNWKCRSDNNETDQTLYTVSIQKQRKGPCNYVDINFFPESYSFGDRTVSDFMGRQ